MSGSHLSVVFPGQGSQKPRMLADFFKNFSALTDTFHDASNIINIDLVELINKGTVEELSKTEITQPLMLTAGVAMWRLLPKKFTLKIKYLAGHSLGEYSALVAAEIITFEEALYLVKNRARFMQEAVAEGKGGMAAILGLPLSKIDLICSEISKEKDLLVSTANQNSLNQTVISGTKKGVDKAIIKLLEIGAKRTILLPMSVPAHCLLMKEASDKFIPLIEEVEFNEPKISVVQNIDAKVANDLEGIKERLVKQIYLPVKWVDTVLFFKKRNISSIFECGPGKVLTNLNKQIFKNSNNLDLGTLSNFEELIK